MGFHWMVNAWEIGSWENHTKLIICGESGKWVLILFPWYGCFFPITFTSCGILYNMWNTWVSPSISHSMGKCSKIHWIGRVWEIGTHFPPKYGTFLPSDSHPMVLLYHTGNAWLFPSISNSTGKYSKTHLVSSHVVFPQYYCFYLFQNLEIP